MTETLGSRRDRLSIVKPKKWQPTVWRELPRKTEYIAQLESMFRKFIETSNDVAQ